MPSGASKINDILSVTREAGYLRYYLGTFQIGFHKEDDAGSFKSKICELVFSGSCRNVDVLNAFGISPTSLKRWLRQYDKNGAEIFHRLPNTRGGTVLTDEVKREAQRLLNLGLSRKEVAKELSISYDVIRKAIKDGRLYMPTIPVPTPTDAGLTRTERGLIDAECGLGVACVRAGERVLAALGKLHGAPSDFQNNYDIEKGGVLCALPALIENGLYSYLDAGVRLSPAYYDTIHIVSLLAFMTLFGVPVMERLRFESPGEIGKLLGLDRIPEVKTLRSKLTAICEDEKAIVNWAEQLTRHWFNARPDLAGVLYVDGHVSVYYGGKTALPRRYVARLRLCMKGSTFYYVNDVMGQPFFAVEQVVDEGLLKTLRNIIVPKLLDLVPNQPAQKDFNQDKYLHRFILIFDREGYSPTFFKEMWEEHNIACVTYHKYPGDSWPEEEFVDVEAVTVDNEEVSMKLAERGTYIGETGKGLWVKEIRKLNESGHQTSIITTLFKLDIGLIAIYMFNRWVQENFFKYMLYFFNLDALIEHGTTPFSGSARVVNPAWKALDYKINSIAQKLRYRLSKFAKIELSQEKNAAVSRKKVKEKAEVLEEIGQFKTDLEKLKAEKKEYPKHISFDELPEDLKFEKLKPTKRLFFDTIKMLVYRAETAMANTVKPLLSRKDDARALIRQLANSHVDILPDKREKILNIKIHRFATRRHDQAVRELLRTLNDTETFYPGTDMKIVYSLAGEKPGFSP
jgi:transposase